MLYRIARAARLLEPSRIGPTDAALPHAGNRFDVAGAGAPSFGTTFRNGNFHCDVFDAAVKALGLKITSRNLRDTAASLAIQAGACVVAVARLLGHESAATTLNHYAGLFPTDLNDVADRLDSAARQTIAQQSVPPDAKEAPTKHRPERNQG